MNIYTGRGYTFAMAHINGLIPLEEEIIKNKLENFQVLNDAIRLQNELAIIHRQRHSKDKSTQT